MAAAALRDASNWVLGALGSIFTVGAAALFDPTGTVFALLSTTLAQAPTLFTLSSLGLAAGDRLGGLFTDLQPWLLGVWVGSGLLFAGGLIDRYWDALKERLT